MPEPPGNAHAAPQTPQLPETAPTPPYKPQPPGPHSIQVALDEVVWFHGNDPLMWSSSVYQGLLAKGIEVHYITRERLIRAQKHIDKVRNQRLRAMKQHPDRPVDTTWPVPAPGLAPSRREQLIHNLRKLCQAKKRLTDAPVVYNNTSSGNGAGASQPSEETLMSTALQVKESDFRSALVAMGFDNANNPEKWDLRRLNRKVSSPEEFDSLVEAMKSAPEGADHDLIANMGDVLREGGSIDIVSDTEVETAVHETNGHGEDPVQTQEPSKKKGKKMTTATAPAPRKTKATKGGKPAAKPVAKATKNKESTRGPSLLDAAAQVLKASKKPLKVEEIFNKIQEKGLWEERKGKTPKATLAAAIYVEIKKKGDEARFEKAERGEFRYKG